MEGFIKWAYKKVGKLTKLFVKVGISNVSEM